MEAFSLLKYWKAATKATLTAPSATSVFQNDVETDADDGPFFDLELAVPDEEEEDDDNNVDSDFDSDSDLDSERELKLTLSPSTSSNDPSISLTPSHDFIFKENLILNSSESEPNSKPQFTASLLKSATKFRVFMLGLKKSKPKPNAASDNNEANAPTPKVKKARQKKLFTVKFKVEETPMVSLFTRENSSRGKASEESESESSQREIVSSASEEKRLMRKYLKMVKPLYVRVSRRYAEKLKFSEQVDLSSPESAKAATPPSTVPTEAEASETEGTASVKGQKQGSVPLPAALRKHLGKARSPPPFLSSKRRDDSLLQQQDWIQGAILHCKTSFNASTECRTSELPRSVSHPLRDISAEKSGNDK